MVNNMNKNKYEKIIYALYITAVFPVIIIPAVVYIVTSNIPAAIICLAATAVLYVLMLLVHYIDNLYITKIISDLSKLMDNLTELQEKQIFPENEDTVVSKLQNKVIKLVNILKKKNNEALCEHENIKSLVSDISHQLKTPIANLIMYSRFLKDDSISDDKRREYIDIICLSINRLNFLSESMIKISRLESGIISLNMQNQSLNETVLKALKDVYAKAKAGNIEIIYNEETNISLIHDRNWTSEAIFNLLDNAVKYSDSGSTVSLSVKSFGMFAAIEVTDQNNPIPADEQNKIFSRFYRGRNSRGEGIGVGLYLARKITVMQGGYISLKCNEHGNTFSIVMYIAGH